MGDNEGLLTRLKAGSESAWEEAFRQLYPLALSAARTPLAALNDMQAEDAAIEALTQLVAHVAAAKTWHDLRLLTVTIATRRAISERRRLAAEKRGNRQTDSLEALQLHTDGVFEAVEKASSLPPIELRELGVLLQKAMADLPPLTQTLIREFILDHIPYKELSQKHQIPLGTVGIHLARGLQKVRSQLEAKPAFLKEIREYLRY